MKRTNILYLAVSPDVYELPFVVTDSLKELSNLTGVKKNNILSAISKKLSGVTIGIKFLRIEVDDDQTDKSY